LSLKPSYTTFIVDTRLPIVSKKEFLKQFSNKVLKHSPNKLDNDIKIFLIPLPDFNKSTIISKDKIFTDSFFIRFIQKASDTIYNNFTIEAMINFNWNTHAFQLTFWKLIFLLIDFVFFNLLLLPFLNPKTYECILNPKTHEYFMLFIIRLLFIITRIIKLSRFIGNILTRLRIGIKFLTDPIYFQVFYGISCLLQLMICIFYQFEIFTIFSPFAVLFIEYTLTDSILVS